MAEYQIMYWKNIPVQLRVTDATSELNVALPARFQEAIDAIAMHEGLMGSDAYMDAWHWGDTLVLPGPAEAVAREVEDELVGQFAESAEEIVNQILER